MEDDKLQNPIRVLQVTIGDGSYGGVASFLFSYYSNMDREKIHCDFLYCGENSMQSKQDSPVLKDSNITALHIIKAKNNGYREYSRLLGKLKDFFAKNEYDIVHINTSNVLVTACVISAVHGRAICIAHSHNTKAVMAHQNKIKGAVKDLLKMPGRAYILKKADYYFACSIAAGENLFGAKALKSPQFRLIKNAINLSEYVYDPSIRASARNTDRFVIGHVGRLTEQKNPLFLLDVFFEIQKINPNTELWMVGEGELEDTVRQRIAQLGLQQNVTLWGRRNDVSALMQAMDIFMLPSLYEGLSIVAIEAQAAGLPVYASTSISKEHQVTQLVQFLPLSSGPKEWAEKITADIDSLPQRRNMTSEMKASGYEITQASKQLQEFYMSLMNR